MLGPQRRSRQRDDNGRKRPDNNSRRQAQSPRSEERSRRDCTTLITKRRRSHAPPLLSCSSGPSGMGICNHPSSFPPLFFQILKLRSQSVASIKNSNENRYKKEMIVFRFVTYSVVTVALLAILWQLSPNPSLLSSALSLSLFWREICI